MAYIDHWSDTKRDPDDPADTWIVATQASPLSAGSTPKLQLPPVYVSTRHHITQWNTVMATMEQAMFKATVALLNQSRMSLWTRYRFFQDVKEKEPHRWQQFQKQQETFWFPLDYQDTWLKPQVTQDCSVFFFYRNKRWQVHCLRTEPSIQIQRVEELFTLSENTRYWLGEAIWYDYKGIAAPRHKKVFRTWFLRLVHIAQKRQAKCQKSLSLDQVLELL